MAANLKGAGRQVGQMATARDCRSLGRRSCRNVAACAAYFGQGGSCQVARPPIVQYPSRHWGTARAYGADCSLSSNSPITVEGAAHHQRAGANQRRRHQQPAGARSAGHASRIRSASQGPTRVVIIVLRTAVFCATPADRQQTATLRCGYRGTSKLRGGAREQLLVTPSMRSHCVCRQSRPGTGNDQKNSKMLD
jgi:hypothetical protein